MNREIVDYKIVEGDIIRIQQDVKKSISAGRRPIGGVSHVSITHKSHYTQAMVKYAPLPDSVQLSVKYCQSNGLVCMSNPEVYTCKNCGQQRRGGQTTPVCKTLPTEKE